MQHPLRCRRIRWGFGWGHWMAKLSSHLEERCQCKLCQCKTLPAVSLCWDINALTWASPGKEEGRAATSQLHREKTCGCSAPRGDAGKSRVGACHPCQQLGSLSARTGGGRGALSHASGLPQAGRGPGVMLPCACRLCVPALLQWDVQTHFRGARLAGRELCFPQANPPRSSEALFLRTHNSEQSVQTTDLRLSWSHLQTAFIADWKTREGSKSQVLTQRTVM